MTVGSPEKRSAVATRYGLPDSHILNSRDPADFAEQIQAATHGRGVDVVVNSLPSGEGLRYSCGCLAPFGRFVEVGSRNMARNAGLEMARFASNAVFAVVSLWELLRARPEVVSGIWAECMGRFRDGSLAAPWPIATFPFSDLGRAMRVVSAGNHVGKVVLVRNSREVAKVIITHLSVHPTHFLVSI